MYSILHEIDKILHVDFNAVNQATFKIFFCYTLFSGAPSTRKAEYQLIIFVTRFLAVSLLSGKLNMI